MIKTLIICMSVAVALLLAGLMNEKKTTGYQLILPEEAKRRIEEGDVTIVDVRTPEEYAAGYIPDAILVPNEKIETEAPAVLPDKSRKLLVYCRSGRRSAEAAKKLVKLGYSDVADFGGIVDWEYEIIKP